MRAQTPARDGVRVRIVSAHADKVEATDVTLQAGACVRDALVACTLGEARAILEAHERSTTSAHIADSFVGIWGRRVLLDLLLADGDRIELYRELIADPKAARLNRASEQGYRWQGRTRRAAK